MKARVVVFTAALLASACGAFVSFDDYGVATEAKPVPTFHVRGSAEGLDEAMVSLDLAGERITVGNGPFSFAKPIEDGRFYAVIMEPPATHACGIEGASGTIAGADATMAVRCVSRSTALASLELSNAPLAPAFSPATRTYASARRAPPLLSGAAMTTQVRARAAHPRATMSLNGAPLLPDALSAAIPIEHGKPITIEVVSPAGDERAQYTVIFDVRVRDYIKASNTREQTRFGNGLAYENDVLAVGSQWEASNATGVNGDQTNTLIPGAGAVYVFHRVAGIWAQEAYLKPADVVPMQTLFGRNLAFANGTLVVGANGSAYVFVRNGGQWMQQAKLLPPPQFFDFEDTWKTFGGTVGISGDTIAIGAPHVRDNEAGMGIVGAVHIFERTAGVWSYATSLRPETEDECGLGARVSLTGDTLATAVSCGSGFAGPTVVYRRMSSTWSREARLTPGNPAYAARLGVRVVGNTLVRATSGPTGETAHVYERVQGTWTETAVLNAPIVNGPTGVTALEFGHAIAIQGDVIAVAGERTTRVSLFRRSATGWTPLDEVVPRAQGIDTYTTVELSPFGDLFIGDGYDMGNATGVNGEQNQLAPLSGAVWVY